MSRVRWKTDVSRARCCSLCQPEYCVRRFDYRKFQADEALARTQLERSQLLYRAGPFLRRMFKSGSVEQNQGRPADGRQRIGLLGGDLKQFAVAGSEEAPVSGTIVRANVPPALDQVD